MKRVLAKILILGIAGLSGSCFKAEEKNKAGPGNQPILVSTTKVTRKNVPLTLQAMGNAESCHSVAIKSRVESEIVKVHVVDGQEVLKGTPLFDLDDRPFRYRLDQLKANLQRDLALQENARTKEHRQNELKKQQIASEEILTTLTTTRQAAEATVAADRAAIAEGELQLGFTRIFAPISGKAGKILMQPGNQVKANDANPLVIIHQVDPICITFTVAEQHLLVIQTNHAKAPLTMQVYPNQETTTQPILATLLSMDNTVDRQTATIRLQAKSENPDRRLWPGMFVTLTLKLTDRPEALVIPAEAMQTGPKGAFTYVVKPDKTVEARPITLAQENKEEAVVATGLVVDEQVVTVGQWRLKPGSQVEIFQPQPVEKP